MKEILLRDGQNVTQVDDDLYEYLSQWTWRLHSAGYACRSEGTAKFGTYKTILMHREVAKAMGKQYVDHIDSDKLNNQRSNLRIGTQSQNMGNTDARGGTSRFKGVHRTKRGKWYAKIGCKGKYYNLGQYETEEEAALAYNKRAIELFGDYARLNVI